MDFSYSEKTEQLRVQLRSFMDEHIVPRIGQWNEEVHSGQFPVSFMDDLKYLAKSDGLWNLFLPHLRDDEPGTRLTNLEYAPLAEIMGRVLWAPEIFNCNAPDTGNMEVIHDFGTEEQKERWLTPLLEGEIRSCFSMTEPDVASSDPRNLETTITADGDSYVVDGTKWWSTGGVSNDCKVAIVMGVTNEEAPPKERYSMILVPLDAEGVEVVRDLSVFGYHDRGGHAEIRYDSVQVPASNLIAGEGNGYMIAQARLGPGRIHHCMRCIGVAERALEMMCRRAKSRVAFGRTLAEMGVTKQNIAQSRMDIEQARLLTLHAAYKMDTVGNKAARAEIAMIKVVAPNMALDVIDRAVQVHGGGGVSGDFGLAYAWAHSRTLRLADGPDEVHRASIAKGELRGQTPRWLYAPSEG